MIIIIMTPEGAIMAFFLMSRRCVFFKVSLQDRLRMSPVHVDSVQIGDSLRQTGEILTFSGLWVLGEKLVFLNPENIQFTQKPFGHLTCMTILHSWEAIITESITRNAVLLCEKLRMTLHV